MSCHRMLDSLTLFSSICKNPHLKGISIILFLNKVTTFFGFIQSANDSIFLIVDAKIVGFIP
jgi:hypothetical protein